MLVQKTENGALDYRGALENAKMLLKNRPKLQYTAPNGDWIPGVTTVLGVLSKDALVGWAHKLGLEGRDYIAERDQSAEVGTIVHYLIECDLNERQPEIEAAFGQDNILKARDIFEGFLDWKIDNSFVSHKTEMALANRSYGGTLDIIGVQGKDNWCSRIYDVKTSSGVYYSHLIQLAAYRRLYREKFDIELEATIIHLPRKGGCKTIDFTKAELDVAELAFGFCLQLYTSRKHLEEVMKSKGTRRRAKA